MKKRTFKIMAIAMVFALIFAFAAIPASAAYTPVSGTDAALSFNKFLIVKDNARIPSMTFTYSITAGSAEDATSTSPAIIAGVGTPTVGTAVFTTGEQTYDTVQNDDAVTLDAGEVYAKKVVDINFRNVAFNQPGIYRYIITENVNANNKAVVYDTQTSGTARTRYLDVYVEDTVDQTTGNNILKVSRYVMHETSNVVPTSADTASDKSTGFVNEIKSHELTFGKEVIGNQGSKDKYFKFTLILTGAQANNTYAVDLSSADPTPVQTDATVYDNMTNPGTITTDVNGDVTTVFYLKDGQYITIKGLPEGYRYTLREDTEDYTSTECISADNNANNTPYIDPVTGQNVNKDIYTGFTNERTGVIPTGVLLTIAPFAIGLLLFGALAVFFVARKKRREGEDE